MKKNSDKEENLRRSFHLWFSSDSKQFHSKHTHAHFLTLALDPTSHSLALSSHSHTHTHSHPLSLTLTHTFSTHNLAAAPGAGFAYPGKNFIPAKSEATFK